MHYVCVNSFNSFRVFDREADGEAYAIIKKQIPADADVNIFGQPELFTEPSPHLCSKYNYVIEGGVKVGWSFLMANVASLSLF